VNTVTKAREKKLGRPERCPLEVLEVVGEGAMEGVGEKEVEGSEGVGGKGEMAEVEGVVGVTGMTVKERGGVGGGVKVA
jgi:hypothetical protein